MNILLTIGLLLIVGYLSGWLLNKVGLPKIIGYIGTGIAFSPNSIDFIDHNISESTQPLMDVCLSFIAFEVGGALKWTKIKKHGKEIVNITLWASFIPFILISAGVYTACTIFPSILPFDSSTILSFSILLGALASSTAPAATIAVMHQYKAKGKVSDTIMGVAALDDVIGIILFSLTAGIAVVLIDSQPGVIGSSLLNSFYEIFIAILIGVIVASVIILISKFYKNTSEGQWIVILFSLIILCVGLSKLMDVDELLSSMTMGVLVVNRSGKQELIFNLLERYTEEFIFLFFFILSGLHLDIGTIPEATILIVLFVVLRIAGKYLGANIGSRFSKADPMIRKYVAGGLLPQAGIVIGLVLSIYEIEEFKKISGILLATIMGASVINELIGPLTAKYSLFKSGEIKL